MKAIRANISRRDFLRGLGGTAVGTAIISSEVLVAGCAQSLSKQSSSAQNTESGPQSASFAQTSPGQKDTIRKGPARAIDVHHHYFPPELAEEIKRHGKALGVEAVAAKEGGDASFSFTFAGGPPRRPEPALAEVEKRLKVMEEGGILTAATYAATGDVGYGLDAERGENWCNLFNEGLQNLIKQHPKRFVGVALVPMQDPPRAAKVLERAIRDLKFSGAVIASNVNGKYYDSKEFDPFWKKAEELDVLIIMHPGDLPGAERMRSYGLRVVCGNPFDSTLSLGFMIYSGLFDRFPKLKLCLLHGGGFFPFHMGRFDQNFNIGAGREIPAVSRPSKYLQHLYFDNLVYRVETVDYLRRMVGTARVMVETDYPYELGDWKAAEKAEALDCSQAEKDAILFANAKRLLKLP
ncbi:MAG: amidohydrolase [Deltaproteobacteria bacterium]|nr:MAG: amidohydrolase [Deltaproteobacteria bacterium]